MLLASFWNRQGKEPTVPHGGGGVLSEGKQLYEGFTQGGFKGFLWFLLWFFDGFSMVFAMVFPVVFLRAFEFFWM